MDKTVSDFNIRLRTIKLRELFVYILISIFLAGIVLAIFPVVEENGDLLFIVILSFVLLFFIWALRGTTGLSKDFKNVFVEKTRNEILYVFLLNILFAFLFPCLISALDILMGIYDPSWVTGFDIDSVDRSAGAFLLSAISTIVFAPLLEELVCRGVLFNRLKIRIGIVPAMIISSFIFGIGHNFGGITSAFLFGMCMCILYLKTDNILVPISVHFINNFVATILELTSLELIIEQMPWIIPTTIIALIATFLLIKYIVQETSQLKKSLS